MELQVNVGYKLIYGTTLASSVSTISLTGLNLAGYKDLEFIWQGAFSGDGVRVQFNGDTTSANYSLAYTDGYGNAGPSSSGNSSGNNGATFWYSGAITSYPDNAVLRIYNTQNTSIAKHYQVEHAQENNGSNAVISIYGGRWSGTAAISTAYMFGTSAGNFISGGTLSIYGKK